MNVHGHHWIRDALRRRIYNRDDYRCVWCKRALQPGRTMTLDHVLPRERGGSNAPSNLITACLRCNSSRAHKPALVYAFDRWSEEQAYVVLDRVLAAMARELPP